MNSESTTDPASTDIDRTDGHERHDRSIRDCCSGLRDGYAEAWTEAERQRD